MNRKQQTNNNGNAQETWAFKEIVPRDFLNAIVQSIPW